ncbi:MAG: hypothetical protein Q9209_003149 [Squamulea sp. 1 TL-2023]
MSKMPESLSGTVIEPKGSNRAVQFIESLDSAFHPALPNADVAYDHKVDRFRLKADIKRDKIYAPASEGKKTLYAAIIAYEGTRSKGNPGVRLGILHEWNWEAVLDEARQAAEHDAKVNATGGLQGAIRKAFRKLGDSGDAFTRWLAMLPDDAYGSVICGGFKIIINAAVQHRTLCEKILYILTEIPEAVRAAKFSLEEYGIKRPEVPGATRATTCPLGERSSEELEIRVSDLYCHIQQTLCSILDFLNRRASGSWRKLVWNATRAVFKGANYGKDIEVDIQTVRDAVKAVKDEQDRCSQCRIGAIQTQQELQIKQGEIINDKVNATLKGTERSEHSLQIMNAFLIAVDHHIKCHIRDCEKSHWEQRQEIAQEREINLYNQATLAQSLKALSRPIIPEPCKQGPTVQQITHLLGVSPATAIEDARYTLHVGEALSVKLQAQAGAFIGSRAVQDWFTSDETRCLFAQADSKGSDHVSALSFVASLLFQTLQTSPSVVSLLYACGIHTDRYRDPFPNVEGLVRSLIAQLLHAPQCSGVPLEISDNALQVLEDGEITGLCKIFEHLMSQLPHSAILVLLVDGVSSYETEDRVKRTCWVMSNLIRIAEEARCLVKLLVTSSGMSSYVRKGFRDKDILWVPDADGEGVIDFGYAMDELQERIGAASSGDFVHRAY